MGIESDHDMTLLEAVARIAEQAAEIEKLKASPRRRRYDICNALNLTKLSIELKRLERVGASKTMTTSWNGRARALLDDILRFSDAALEDE
jgi:hypothetical protein